MPLCNDAMLPTLISMAAFEMGWPGSLRQKRPMNFCQRSFRCLVLQDGWRTELGPHVVHAPHDGSHLKLVFQVWCTADLSWLGQHPTLEVLTGWSYPSPDMGVFLLAQSMQLAVAASGLTFGNMASTGKCCLDAGKSVFNCK